MRLTGLVEDFLAAFPVARPSREAVVALMAAHGLPSDGPLTASRSRSRHCTYWESPEHGTALTVLDDDAVASLTVRMEGAGGEVAGLKRSLRKRPGAFTWKGNTMNGALHLGAWTCALGAVGGDAEVSVAEAVDLAASSRPRRSSCATGHPANGPSGTGWPSPARNRATGRGGRLSRSPRTSSPRAASTPG